MKDFDHVPSSELARGMIPLGTRDWGDLCAFALSYDGYGQRGFDACACVANATRETWRESGDLPDELEDLRTCLFFEQRRWRHFQRLPNEEAWRYFDALIEKIRKAVCDLSSQ